MFIGIDPATAAAQPQVFITSGTMAEPISSQQPEQPAYPAPTVNRHQRRAASHRERDPRDTKRKPQPRNRRRAA